MKLKSYIRLAVIVIALVFCAAAFAAPRPFGKDRDKDNSHDGTKVDSGSFGIYQKGNRIGTETFSIYQTASGSVIDSQFKTINAPTPSVQSSEMQLNRNGEIKRYSWKEQSPGTAESEVVPNDDFLTQKWRASAQDKQHDKPYLMPAATSILDDYFFVHREVLAWKFVAMSCSKQGADLVTCPPKQRTPFATLNPHEQSSASITAESLGRERINLRNGQQQELNKIELKSDSGTWQLWLDDQWKVIRISVLGDNTEVERD